MFTRLYIDDVLSDAGFDAAMLEMRKQNLLHHYTRVGRRAVVVVRPKADVDYAISVLTWCITKDLPNDANGERPGIMLTKEPQ